MPNKKCHRLNKPKSTEYAIFIINENDAIYRRFEYYLGPEIEEKTLSVTAARQKYAELSQQGWAKPVINQPPVYKNGVLQTGPAASPPTS